MTDREMLEFAAKAAGYDSQGMEDGKLYLFGVQDGWNPLTNAADRWNLAAACKMTIDFEAGFVLVLSRDGAVLEYSVENEGQSLDWCVVRAAAEIGRNLP